MRKNICLTTVITLGLLLQGQIYAAEKPVQEDLHKTVLTNNRIKKEKIQVPANVQVITREDIDKHGYRTVLDALRSVPGVYVRSGGYNATEQQIAFNGDDKILFLVDGHRINFATGSIMGNSGVDAGALPSIRIVEKIEIIKGAASAMYGSNASGGVVQIFTMRPQEDSVTLEAGIGNMKSYLYDGTLTAKRGKWGLLVSGGREYQIDTKFTELGGLGSPLSDDNSKWQFHDLTMKLDREFADDQLLTINYQHTFKKSTIPDGIPEYYFPDTLRNNTRQTNSLSAKYEWNRDEDNGGSLIVFHDFYKVKNSQHNQYWEGKENRSGFEAQQQYKTSKVNTLVFGASYYNSALDNDSYTGDGEFSLHNTGLSVSDQWQISDSWLLNAGARYDKHSEFGSNYTWSAGLNKKINDVSHAYLNYGTVFNAPTGNMLYERIWSSDGTLFKGNKALDAEKGYHWVAGYDWQITPKTEVGINFFYYRLKDAITFLADNSSYSSFTAGNVPGLRSRGMEININHTFDRIWSAYASYSTVNYDINSGTGFQDDATYAPNQYKVGVNYRKGKLTLDLLAQALSGMEIGYYKKNSYITADLVGKYQFTDHMGAFAGIYNMGNTAYAETPFYQNNPYPARSRYIMGGVTYKF